MFKVQRLLTEGGSVVGLGGGGVVKPGFTQPVSVSTATGDIMYIIAYPSEVTRQTGPIVLRTTVQDAARLGHKAGHR
jgi:hypothetical protein